MFADTRRILAIDADVDTLAQITVALATRGFEVTAETSVDGGLSAARTHAFDLVVYGAGCDTVEAFVAQLKDIPVVLLSDPDLACPCAFARVRRPLEPRELTRRVAGCLLLRRAPRLAA